jgi:hypothetical protein
VTFLSELLAAERVARGTRTGSRAPSCTDQAVFALVWFRESRDIPLIGRGLGISQATAYRYLDEAVKVLADRAPDLHDALQRGLDEGWSKQPADGSELDINTRTRNMLLRAVSCLGEHGFALLTGRWRTLQHITVSPSKITKIARAALVLTHFEHSYLPC